jgi:hypothetical protein
MEGSPPVGDVGEQAGTAGRLNPLRTSQPSVGEYLVEAMTPLVELSLQGGWAATEGLANRRLSPAARDRLISFAKKLLWLSVGWITVRFPPGCG